MPSLTIEEVLKKYDTRYYKYSYDENVINIFMNNLNLYLDKTKTAIMHNETEENLKNITNSFLKFSAYNADKYDINTEKRIDSVIKENGNIRVIIENKNPKNKNEMVSKDDINVKALHEVIFYYLNETRDVTGNKVKRIPNIEIRRVIITDNLHWVIIDANEIEKIIDGYLEKLYYKYSNKQLIYSNNVEKFYKDIEQYLDTISINDKLNYVYFNIETYTTSKKIQYLYKLFNKYYLLKENFHDNENSHTLNEKFYQELLYIMGLKEKIGKSNKTIEIDHTIKNSLSDQVFKILKNDKEYDEITCTEKTFELIIIWINRLLFIKLFEGQLISFNGDFSEYYILDNDKISSFQDLQDLFFEVLGKKERDNTDFLNQFYDVPYLNSSLFERYDIEKNEININMIKNNIIFKKKNSVVGSKKLTELPLLEYILKFLNSYDFASEIDKDNRVISSKDIIDASVLGLIFEKLNGYRDGSFYTPSVITEYMSKKSIEKAILDRINKAKLWTCTSLSEVKVKINNNMTLAKEINNVINEVKICDISVGSGHFLVSALNRVIAIKKKLGVLFKYNTNELITEYDIVVIDDVLRIFDGQGKDFKYNKNNFLSQQVQETMFNEKRIIIENCLFGVDINQKAVSICQLRLWIELLKNAYYKDDVMETLPNIDINIKSGNSLINRIEYTVGVTIGKSNEKIEKNLKKLINQYKKMVMDYKGESDKTKKANIKNQINSIKSDLRYLKSQIELVVGKNNEISYFVDESDKIYSGAFEWAIEFPELLDEKGVFQGFDCILGNPPYGLLNKKQNHNTSISVIPEVYDFYKNSSLYEHARGGIMNIYRMFICRCFSLLKKNGHCCLIFPLAFMGDLTNANIRKYIMENTKIDFLEAFPERDSESKRVFKEVKMSVCILGATKEKVNTNYKFPVRINKCNYVDENNEIMNISYDEIKIIDDDNNSIPLIKQHELDIFIKMTKDSKRMVEYSKCYTGEIDISLDKKYISFSEKDNLMLRGAQVQKYYITNDISQGEIFYLKADSYLKNNTGERSLHHKRRRIVMQGITGVNERWRLKLTMADASYFCANSVNYLIPSMDNDFDYYILGLLNSRLLNWYFSKMSTNSNVNGYEIDNLPIKVGNDKQVNDIVALSKNLVIYIMNNESPKLIVKCIKRIDEIVYDIYEIKQHELPIIET